MGRVAILILIVMALLFICSLCLVVYTVVRTPSLDRPLTSAETLKAAPHFDSNIIRHPRLTSWGKAIVFMAVAFGGVATAVSLALGWRIATTGLTNAALPAVVTVLILDLVPVAFVALLHRTYKLVLTGQFATGIVVAAKIGSIRSSGLFYDFLDGAGKVVRGSSSRSFYTVALARCFYGADMGSYFEVGSYVPVLFRADDSSRNAPYVSFPWAI
jgi:hypothetical protein